MLDELGDIQDEIKKGTNSSPKSAHHAMGLESAHYDDYDHDSKKLKNDSENEDEQRKGLWRSIFGYFRGPNKKAQNKEESKSLKSSNA